MMNTDRREERDRHFPGHSNGVAAGIWSDGGDSRGQG
jgi:hypothetical protein